MRSRPITQLSVLFLSLCVPLIASSCSSNDNSTGTGGTGAGATGGGSGTGTGGTGAAGMPGVAGMATSGSAGTGVTGGTGGMATGGRASSGGSPGTGGGGAPAAGGVPGAGGVPTAGTGSGGMPTAGNGMGGEGGEGGVPDTGMFAITSPTHMEGAMFADKFTCTLAGFNGSIIPEIHWTAGPAGTKSYAITFIDTTLTTKMPPDNNGYHWAIYNIPAATLTLPEGFKMEASIGAKETGDFLGPCPNFGGGSANTDTYKFTIYALDTEMVTIAGSGTTAVKNAETLLEGMHLAKATLSGTSNASPP